MEAAGLVSCFIIFILQIVKQLFIFQSAKNLRNRKQVKQTITHSIHTRTLPSHS